MVALISGGVDNDGLRVALMSAGIKANAASALAFVIHFVGLWSVEEELPVTVWPR